MEEKEDKKEDLKIEELKKKLEECEKLKNEYLTGWQRSRADFLNYKKEEIERMEKLGELVRTEMILKILKILDNFERAEKEISEDSRNSNWMKGILQIKNQFLDFLKEEGVEEIKTEGEKFDPNFQEAIEKAEAKDKKPGQIVEVLEKGYLLNGQLLRPAKVKIAK
ncbi:MAG: nucleotide exchange factor GrpE [Patescibacteria group bacterium]|nr:nucleotide exchange factor GrpE [Patescibacteria group bacterium]